mmetsp:Transcript_9466/g.23235  ORF Transcript_9466/g.23235 Transcript_9466/m.23235 type:complete len:980 (+) Transcript_9466:148-3087(+)
MSGSMERRDVIENATKAGGKRKGAAVTLTKSSKPTRFLASLALVLCLSSMTIRDAESFQTTTTAKRSLLVPITNARIAHHEKGSLRTIGHGSDHESLAASAAAAGRSRDGALYLFGRNKDGDGSKNSKSTSINESEDSGDGEKKRSKIPFFGRLKRSKTAEASTIAEESTLAGDEPRQEEEEPPSVPVAAMAVATITETETETAMSTESASTSTKATVPAKVGPSELRPPNANRKGPSADDLKLMAEKARLEAERLDAELTLSKIEKLEQQLVQSKKGEDDGNVVVENLQMQLDALQAKLRGETVPTSKPTVDAAVAPRPEMKDAVKAPEPAAASESSPYVARVPVAQAPRTGAVAEIDDDKVLKAAEKIANLGVEATLFEYIKTKEDLEVAPEFLLRIIGPFYGMMPDAGERFDKAELIDRFARAKNLDYGFFDRTDPPVFSRSDIRQHKLAILTEDMNRLNKNAAGKADDQIYSLLTDEVPVIVTPKMIEKAEGNATQLTIYSMEYDYYFLKGIEDLSTNLPDSMGLTNSSFFETMYPKCVVNRGENMGDDYVSEEPTDAQIDALVKTILPAVKFSSSSKPQRVAGGYTISGSHKYDDGDKLLEAIDNEIAKSRPNLKDQLTVLYTPSYGLLSINLEEMNSMGNMNLDNLLAEQDVLDAFANSEPILFITGPTIVRDANRVGLALTSILGLATSWYLSVYPFLLNDKIASRIDADLQLVEANLQPDMSYLTDLSIPLFFCFMSLQFIHEAAHRLVAFSKGVTLSVPVFVPSLITGVTSTVTTFKTLPKNKNDMFDISAAGPLAGVVASSVALVVGSKLTLISDPATLPALPLDILRQSTLGGAIIDQVITGSLYVPEGASAAGINIPLHPIGIAGFVGLIVNALALLPIGTTDGGRLTMALFDRAEKLSIGTLTLASLFFAGVFGSDLFLFYFSFCLAFQTGNEVPARNEQDSVDFSRIFVALVCYGLAILTLVPVQ